MKLILSIKRRNKSIKNKQFPIRFGTAIFCPPVTERKCGYYALPVLCENKLIALIEMETDKKGKTLIVNNFWAEDGIDISKYRSKIISGINYFKEYNQHKISICS